MHVNPADTFEIAAREYRRYRRRRRIALEAFWVGYLGFGVVVIVNSRLPYVGSIWVFVAAAISVFVVVTLAFRRRYRKLADEALPTIEEKTLSYLQEAVKSLGAFIQQRGGEALRKECLKNLSEAAALIDEWTIGNLQFLERTFGQKIEDFKTGFRFRLIPMMKKAKADSPEARDIQNFVSISSQNQILSGVDGARLDSWNSFLNNFPEISPDKGILERLISKTAMYHAAYLITVFILGYAYWGLQRSILGADVNTSTNGLGIVLGILLGPYVVFLFWKYVYRGKGSSA